MSDFAEKDKIKVPPFLTEAPLETTQGLESSLIELPFRLLPAELSPCRESPIPLISRQS